MTEKAKQKSEIKKNTFYIIYVHPLPSSMWMSHGYVASTATPPANPTRVRWRRTSAGAHLIVVPTGRRHGSPPPSARGHSVKPTVSTTGPASTHGEPSHEPAATPPLFKHHGESTIFICFIIEVRVVGLCTALYGSLQTEDRGRYTDNQESLQCTDYNISVQWINVHLQATMLFLT